VKLEGLNERSKKKRMKLEVSFEVPDEKRRHSSVPLSQ